MKEMRVNLVFPVLGPGGVQTLYTNLMKHCVARGIKVRLFDIENGYLSRTLKKECSERKIDCIIGVPEWRRSNIEVYDRFIITNYSLPSLYKYFPEENVRFLYYDVFAPSLRDFYLSWPLRLINHQILSGSAKKLVEDLNRKKSLATMDVNGVVTLENEFGVSCDKIIPIPVGIKYVNEKKNYKYKKNLCVGMVSRAVDWKMGAFRLFVEKLDTLTFENLKFLVITDNVSKAVDLIGPLALAQNVVIRSEVSIEKLPEILLNEVDIYVGMGTTILDAASLGIASFILAVGKYETLESEGLYNFNDAEFGDLGSSKSSTNKSDIYKLFQYDKRIMIDTLANLGDEAKKKALIVHDQSVVLDRLLESAWSAEMKCNQLGKYICIRLKALESKCVWLVKKILRIDQAPFFNY